MYPKLVRRQNEFGYYKLTRLFCRYFVKYTVFFIVFILIKIANFKYVNKAEINLKLKDIEVVTCKVFFKLNMSKVYKVK